MIEQRGRGTVTGDRNVIAANEHSELAEGTGVAETSPLLGVSAVGAR